MNCDNVSDRPSGTQMDSKCMIVYVCVRVRVCSHARSQVALDPRSILPDVFCLDYLRLFRCWQRV